MTADREMTWREFVQWATDVHGHRWAYTTGCPGAEWNAIWGVEDGHAAGTRTGSGRRAVYRDVQRRRFAVWLRLRNLTAPAYQADWLTVAESYDHGWLVDMGRGIRWVADPASIADELLRAGFVAIKCGADDPDQTPTQEGPRRVPQAAVSEAPRNSRGSRGETLRNP